MLFTIKCWGGALFCHHIQYLGEVMVTALSIGQDFGAAMELFVWETLP